MKIVPATQAHVEALYEMRLPVTFRGWACVHEGRTLGVVGAYENPTAPVLFMKVTDELRRMPVALMKLAKQLYKLPYQTVVAVCDEEIEASKRFLEHFGFYEIGDGIWKVSRR